MIDNNSRWKEKQIKTNEKENHAIAIADSSRGSKSSIEVEKE